MKRKIWFVFVLCIISNTLISATYLPDSTGVEYPFYRKQQMTFVNGIVRNPGRSASPDADAKYSKTVQVDGITFTLPGELCETMSGCYKADFNNDNVPDYVFINIKVWNGRYCGRSDVAVYVSTPSKKYFPHILTCQALDAEYTDGRPMLVKYDYSEDEVTFIRETYTFDLQGKIHLHRVEKHVLK